MKKHVLMICSANMCRSQLAEGLLQSLLPEFIVASAGLYAVDGRPIDPTIVRLLRDRGIDHSSRRSRRTEQAMFERADLILTMEAAHKREIERRFPPGRGKIFCFDPQQDVLDPYGKPLAAYEAVAFQIARHSVDWARRIDAL